MIWDKKETKSATYYYKFNSSVLLRRSLCTIRLTPKKLLVNYMATKNHYALKKFSTLFFIWGFAKILHLNLLLITWKRWRAWITQSRLYQTRKSLKNCALFFLYFVFSVLSLIWVFVFKRLKLSSFKIIDIILRAS